MTADSTALPKPAMRILRAASALFARKGLAGTTTRMIAARAKMNEAMIFRYFPTKRHLYAAILKNQMKGEHLVEDLGGDTANLEILLRTIATRLLVGVRRDSQFIRLLYFSGLEGHKLASEFYECTMHQIGGFLAAQFEAAMNRGELRSMDTHLLARSFLGMVAHHALVSEVFGFDADRWPNEELVNSFTTLFLQGLQAPAGKRKALAQAAAG